MNISNFTINRDHSNKKEKQGHLSIPADILWQLIKSFM